MPTFGLFASATSIQGAKWGHEGRQRLPVAARGVVLEVVGVVVLEAHGGEDVEEEAHETHRDQHLVQVLG